MPAPKVSIVTAYYKRAHGVRRTLQSFLEQSFGDFELLVVDDASGDDTADAIADFVREANDPRIIPIYNTTNIGMTRNFVKLIEQSRGEHVAIHGSGDVALPQRLAKQSALLDERPEVVLVGSYYTNVVEGLNTEQLQTPDANESTFDTLIAGKRQVGHGEVMFRRSAYNAAGGYRPAFIASQDYDLWLRMIRQGRFATIRESLYQRYVDFEGESFKPNTFLRQQRFKIMARRIAQMPPDEAEKTLEELERLGPAHFIPDDNPELQKRLLRGALRGLLIGSEDKSGVIAKTLRPVHYRLGFKLAELVFTGPLASPSRSMAGRMLNIRQRGAA